MKRVCKQCGKEFELTQSEIQFYKSKNLNIPKRCQECRKANKQARQDSSSVAVQNQKSNHARNVATSSSNAFKRIATTIVIVLLALLGIWFRFSGVFYQDAEDTYTGIAADGVCFRNEELLDEHYRKHGIEMGFSSASAYEAAARSVVENGDSLHKIEAEDGDDVYYLERTNEFVIVSTDGYIRTYFKPNDGIAYYNRQ